MGMTHVKLEIDYITEIKWPKDVHQNEPLRAEIVSIQKPSSF